MSDLHVGAELWLVPTPGHGHGNPRSVRVAKVGRRLATLAGNDGRVDLDTLDMDGGDYSSPGRCWPSKEEWEDSLAVNREWTAFRRGIVNWTAPAGVTIENIREAAKLLGIEYTMPGDRP